MSSVTSSLLVPAPQRETFWQRLRRGARRLRQRPDWAHFAGPNWAERILDLPVTDRFHAKQGRSTGRCVLQADPRGGGGTDKVLQPCTGGPPPRKTLTVYLKRHYRLSWWRGLLAALWPDGGWSPAFQEWEHLEWARQQGVPVPRVVAAGEFLDPWCRLRSFLAVEELTGMLPLHEAIPLAARTLSPRTFRRWKRTLIGELARLTRLLHDRRTFHKDLYLCHFYIDRDDVGRVLDFRGRVYLIDLHRLTHHPWTWRMWQVKDLAQLLYSTEIPGIDDRDRLCFWREYRGPGPWRSTQGWLRAGVLFKWRRYRRHNLRHSSVVRRPSVDSCDGRTTEERRTVDE